MSKKPLRIKEHPRNLLNPQGRKELYILLTDGAGYWLRDLAKKINVSPAAMRGRLTRMHWSHPDMLAPNKTAKKRRVAPGPRERRI